LLILRLGVAAVFLPYGMVKLFTFPARVEFFASTGLPAPEVVTALNVSLKIGIGVLLLLGVQMPLAAALVIFNTLGILTPVNWQAGPLDWWPQVAIRIAPALALALLGPGEFRLRSRDKLERQLEQV
jgi:uncharacterized membrane protein YphA (DoxX/SURF4 family)